MRRFQQLLQGLDRTTGTSAKQQLLENYFREAPAADAAWGLELLLGKRRRRLITGRRLRQVAQQLSGLPPWLFDDCHAQVGDSAETVALTLPAGNRQAVDQPLHQWMERSLPELAALDSERQDKALAALWDGLCQDDIYLLSKLLSGGFRVGVSSGLVQKALAGAAGVEPSTIAQRLMGGIEPSAATFEQLISSEAEAGGPPPGRPYPFFLASPWDKGNAPPWQADHWQTEWKWDGIRAQLIRRQGEVFLWSRGEELINQAFPDVVQLAEQLSDGTVLDGELLVWPTSSDQPQDFGSLQRRLGRKSPGRSLLADCPAALISYDLLEAGGKDLRSQPLRQRRQQLEAMAQNWTGNLRLSATLTIASWEALEQWRSQARTHAAEGLMLKALDSPYLEGRKRGHWWKHKLDPLSLDAVLIYAQAGSGRRANLFTDYTFALWNAELPPQLVTFAKAYSGLNDQEINELDRWIRRNTVQRFGPVRAVKPEQVFEIGFEGIHISSRHKSGIAVRFPRILRWRQDKPAGEADTLQTAEALLQQ